MKRLKVYLRSVQGQLSLLGVTYLGAFALAIIALCLRSVFFEKYVYEKNAPLPERLAPVANDLTTGRVGGAERLKDLSSQDVELLYGAWIDDAGLDRQNHLARSLLRAHGASIIGRLRRTLAAGSQSQRLRAIQLLGLISADELRQEAIQLCRYARDRAQRRGELELLQEAMAVLEQLEHQPDPVIRGHNHER